MARRRLSTSNYDEVQRGRLGDAVAKARAAAGFSSRGQLAAAAGDLSLRSIDKLELGEEGVGQKVLFAVARVLPGWTEETPRLILDGAEPPEPPDGTPERDTGEAADAATGTYVPLTDLPEIGSEEWLLYLFDHLPDEGYFLQIRLLLRNYNRAMERIQELETHVAERDVPQLMSKGS